MTRRMAITAAHGFTPEVAGAEGQRRRLEAGAHAACPRHVRGPTLAHTRGVRRIKGPIALHRRGVIRRAPRPVGPMAPGETHLWHDLHNWHDWVQWCQWCQL